MRLDVLTFLHWLYWASHYLWLALAPDQNDLGNHVVYGGNVLDCITVGQAQAPLHAAFGHAVAGANCVMAP